MLRELVTLWPDGPVVTFADYFVGFKYIFSIAFLCWAIGILRWPNRWWLFCGSLLLASFAWVALELPLGRPYGVVEGERGLSALAQPMVAAARGTAVDGWMVQQPNPHPLWSLALAFASGFDAERLFSMYDQVPLVGIVFLASAVFWSIGAFPDGSKGLARGLAVFFVLFLSSTRLSFLRSPGPFWPDVFGQQPHLAFALGLLVIWLRLLGDARRLPSFLGAGVVLGLIAWMEPRIAAFAVLATIVWLVSGWKASNVQWRTLLSLAVGVVVFLPWTGSFDRAIVPDNTGTWYFAFDHLLALTIDKGLVFYVGLYALVRIVRGGKPPERLFASLVVTGLTLWATSCVSPGVSSWVGLQVAGSSLNLLLAIAAALGVYDLLKWFEQRLNGIQIPGKYLKNRPLRVLGTTALVALSLPWCFPYWWQPILMDQVYVQSVQPVAPQFGPLVSWIEAESEPDAVFVAGPSYSPWIPALSGRRVLLVEPAPVPPADLEDRRQAESWFVESEDRTKIRAAASRWSLTHLAWGRLDRDGPIAVNYSFFEHDRNFSLVWKQGRWIRVFRYAP